MILLLLILTIQPIGGGRYDKCLNSKIIRTEHEYNIDGYVALNNQRCQVEFTKRWLSSYYTVKIIGNGIYLEEQNRNKTIKPLLKTYFNNYIKQFEKECESNIFRCTYTTISDRLYNQYLLTDRMRLGYEDCGFTNGKNVTFFECGSDYGFSPQNSDTNQVVKNVILTFVMGYQVEHGNKGIVDLYKTMILCD